MCDVVPQRSYIQWYERRQHATCERAMAQGENAQVGISHAI